MGRAFLHRLGAIFWPMFFVMVLCLAYLLLFNRPFLTNIRASALSALLFVNNWQQIWAGASYFANYLHPSIFTHLWYMSMYAQIVLLFTLYYRFVRPRLNSSRQSGLFMLGLALLSAGLMAVLYRSDTDPSRVYYGTDTRLFSFALGSFGASWLVEAQPGEGRMGRRRAARRHFPVEVAAWAAGALALWMIFHLPDTAALTYRGGMLVFDLAATVFLCGIISDFSALGRLLAFPGTAWLGRRSNMIYLWYYPVFILCHQSAQSVNFLTRSPWLQLLLIFALALFSYAFLVERRWPVPLFARPKGQPIRLLTELALIVDQQTPALTRAVFSLCLVTLIAAGIGLVIAPVEESAGHQEDLARQQAQALEAANEARSQARLEEGEDSEEEEAETDPEKLDRVRDYYQGLDEEAQYYLSDFTPNELVYAYQLPVSFIGDSLILGVSRPIGALFPEGFVDAEIGRQMYALDGVIRQLQDKDQLTDTVVIDLGANGSFTKSQLTDVLDQLGSERTIYLVNTHVNRPWRDSVNQVLSEVAEDPDDKIYLIDWQAAYQSENREGWLEPDGIHFSAQGAKAWLDCVAHGIFDIQGIQPGGSFDSPEEKAPSEAGAASPDLSASQSGAAAGRAGGTQLDAAA